MPACDAPSQEPEALLEARDPEARAQAAAEALEEVERELLLARERRKELDGIEGRLWARRNRLERVLIHTRGRAWWHDRRGLANTQHWAPGASEVSARE
jgi:hypothetical protein